jgi:hypothetical protein
VQQPPSRSNRTTESIAKIEAEIKKNQHQIAQLHHRNTELRSQLNMISHSSPPSTSSKPNYRRSSDRRHKSRHRKAKTKIHSQLSWTQIVITSLIIVLICAFLGFAIASMITRR